MRHVPGHRRFGLPFWQASTLPSGEKPLFNYRRIWVKTVLGMSIVALVPLVVMTLFNLYQYDKTLAAESTFPVMRLVSDTQRTIEAFLEERKAAIEFVVHDNDFAALSDQGRLQELFVRMDVAFGGFVDLGVIDETGKQLAYVGPYDLHGKNYADQDWFEQVSQRGIYVSDVFRGYRDVPHMVIAAKHDKEQGGFYIVRATIDAALLTSRINPQDGNSRSDVFIINQGGILQTTSTRSGKVLDRYSLHVPSPTSVPVVKRVEGPGGRSLILGHVYIADTPFILVVAKQHRDILSGWWKLRATLLTFLALSSAVILIVVVAVVTFLVEGAYEADMRRTITVHQMEHTSKMASVGRLAAGVAHEINNPLAIIGEKAGLIKDLFTISKTYAADERLMGLVDSILAAVERCSTITHRLLGFAKHVDVTLDDIDPAATVKEVLGLLGKEAEYREIRISLDAEDGLPKITTDRGQLQQVLLNIINNALDAVKDRGRIDIGLASYRHDRVSIVIADDGCGIGPSDQKRIFEPFFTTKKEKGTGLGLSITYGLVQKLGGEIRVDSELGKGTRFTVLLPIRPARNTTGQGER